MGPIVCSMDFEHVRRIPPVLAHTSLIATSPLHRRTIVTRAATQVSGPGCDTKHSSIEGISNGDSERRGSRSAMQHVGCALLATTGPMNVGSRPALETGAHRRCERRAHQDEAARNDGRDLALWPLLAMRSAMQHVGCALLATTGPMNVGSRPALETGTTRRQPSFKKRARTFFSPQPGKNATTAGSPIVTTFTTSPRPNFACTTLLPRRSSTPSGMSLPSS